MVNGEPSNIIDIKTGKPIEEHDSELKAIRLQCKKALPATARLLNDLAVKFREKFPRLADAIHPSGNYYGKGTPKKHPPLPEGNNHSSGSESLFEVFQDWLAYIVNKK